jgi:hypothetical protein
MKDVGDAVERLRENMDGARGIRFARQGGVQFPGSGGCSRRLASPFVRPRLFERLAQIVGGFAGGGPPVRA